MSNFAQPQSFLGSEEEEFYVFLPYLGMAAILFNNVEPSEQIVNTSSMNGRMRNLVIIWASIFKEGF